MKKIIFSLAFMLIGLFSFANTQSVEKHENVTIENCKDKLNIKYNLGNVSNLTEAELNLMCDNFVSQNFDFTNEVDECTVSITAEVNGFFGKFSVTVSYTASTCEIAARRAKAALAEAIEEVREAF